MRKYQAVVLKQARRRTHVCSSFFNRQEFEFKKPSNRVFFDALHIFDDSIIGEEIW